MKVARATETRLPLLSPSSVVLVLWLVMTSAWSSEIEQAKDSVESFKSFLSQRPNIRLISYSSHPEVSAVFLRKYAPDLVNKAIPNRANFATGCWQPEQYLLKVYDPQKPGVEVTMGYDGGDYWQISGGVVSLFVNDKHYAATIEATLSPFFDVLSLGVPSLKDGTAVWKEHVLHASSSSGQKIEGVLTVTDGQPKQLDCSIHGNNTRYRIEYYYDASRGFRGLPGRFRVSAKPEDEQEYRALKTIDISALELTGERLPQEVAAIYRTAQYKNRSWIVFSNDVSYMLSASGGLVKSSNSRPYQQSRAGMIRLVFVFGAVIIPGIVGLAWLRRKKTRTTQ